MPLPMVHLKVADMLAPRLKLQDKPAFYLGSIAPDGVHMLEDCRYEDKDRSHLYCRSTGKVENVAKFLGEISRYASRDYGLGYGVHVLTDMLWLVEVFRKYEKKYEADTHHPLEKSRFYYSDTDQLDIMLYNTMGSREEIWQMLSQARAVDLPGILCKEAADMWNKRTLAWFDEKREYAYPVTYISEEELKAFLIRAEDHCAKFLCNYI